MPSQATNATNNNQWVMLLQAGYKGDSDYKKESKVSLLRHNILQVHITASAPCTCFSAPFLSPHLPHYDGGACLTDNPPGAPPKLVLTLHTRGSVAGQCITPLLLDRCLYCLMLNQGNPHSKYILHRADSCAANSALRYKQDEYYKDAPAPESYDKSEVRVRCMYVCAPVYLNMYPVFVPAALYPMCRLSWLCLKHSAVKGLNSYPNCMATASFLAMLAALWQFDHVAVKPAFSNIVEPSTPNMCAGMSSCKQPGVCGTHKWTQR